MNKYFDEHVFEGPVEGAGGGGGGCFPAGERVFTSHGYKPIEKLRVGDLVVAFDKFGNLEHGAIRHVHKHSKEQNNSGILTFTFEDDKGNVGTLNVTGNHAIFCGDITQTQFKQAQEFVVGDVFYHVHGGTVTITDVVSREINDEEFTYNLTVDPQHTYTVNDIRVHNGGGGKSGGSSRPAQEDPNTLRSTNIARIMEVISEGPIEGLATNSLKDIYFNETPVQNADNSYNFGVRQADFRIGLPVQDYVTGFNGVESVIPVGTEITPAITVTRSLQALTDAAVVQIRLVAGLSKQDKTNGDLHGHSVQIAIDVKPTAGTWTEVIAPTITGKTMTAYDTQYRINRPVGATTWDIRIRRVSPADVDSSTQSRTAVYQITEVQEIKLSYPEVAYAAMALDAQSVGNTVPVRSYDVKGILCPIPTNYNPITRVYTGIWNGTFTTAWTDNPAWIVYDLLTNTRYGLGNFIDVTTIDVASFYQASQYNDQLVNDGNGGTEPRFTFNQPIVTREEAWKLVQSIASTMRAVVLPGGVITLVQDRPTSPVKIVTNSNVKDGMFTYTGSGLLARHTVVNVLYNDKNGRYFPRVVTEEDTDAIARYGYNPIDLTAYGTVTEGQARRAGKWLLDTELNQTELITYETGFNQADLIPGDVIYVMDNDYVTSVLAGRITGGDLTTVTLDDEVVLNPGVTYKITMVDADGYSLLERTITNVAGSYTTVTLNTALPNSAQVLVGREWMITSVADVSARQFRVISVREQEKGLFSISALYYDPNKYDRVELGITNPALVYSDVVADVCGQISNIVGTLEQRQDEVIGPVLNLRLSWDVPATLYTVGYKVSYSRNNSPFVMLGRVDNNNVIIENVTEGTYLVQIIAYNIKGVQSAPYVQTLVVGYGTDSSLYPPTSVSIVAGHGTGTEWYGQDCIFEWVPNANNELIVGQSVGGYSIKVYDNDTLTLLHTATVPKTQTSYIYTMSDNIAEGGPFRELKVEVRTLNTMIKPSTTAVSAVFTNFAPALPVSITTGAGTSQYTVNVTYGAHAADEAGVVIYQGTTVGFTPGPGNIVYQGAANDVITIPQSPGSYFIRLAVYDTFGISGLNNSTAMAVSSLALGSVPAPAIPTGLALTAFLDQSPDGSQSGRIVATWNANTGEFSDYEIRIRDVTGSGQYSSTLTTATSHAFTGLKVANQYGVQIQARNLKVGSGYTAEALLTTIGDTIAPGSASALSVTSSFKNNWLVWTKATDGDLRGTQVWASATNDRAAAVLLTTTDDTSFVHSGLNTGETRYYWIRSIDTSGNTSGYYPVSSTAGVVGTTVGTATTDYQNLSIVSAAIADATIDNAKIANATISGAKISTATIDTLNLKNGSISDVKALVNNTPVIISSATLTNGSGTYSYGATEVFRFIFTTANPTTTETSFFTYFHAFCNYDVYCPTDINIYNNGGNNVNTNVRVNFLPLYRVKIIRQSDSANVFTSSNFYGAAAISVGDIDFYNNGGDNVNYNVVLTGSTGTNVVFGTTNLTKNTQYALVIEVVAGDWTYANTTGQSLQFQVRATQRAAYIQTLLR